MRASRAVRLAWWHKLVVLVVTTALCLLAFEFGFRLLGYRAIYDSYSKPELFWTYDPILGWALQPGAHGRYVGPRPFPIEFRTSVRVNSLGLRGAEPVPLPRKGRRVLVLGDSIVAGFEVPEQRTYTALLQARLSARLRVPVQVVNAGIRGYGTDQEYLLYRDRLRALRPDVVVLHVVANDPEDNTTLHRMRRPFGKPGLRIQRDGSLALVGAPVPRYPMCSSYRLDASYRSVRVDGVRARAICWVQTRLADHSAALTFVSSRIERNPRLVKALYDLGAPRDNSPAVPAAPPPPDPRGAAPGTRGSTTPQPPAIGYEQRLTSRLVAQIGDVVRADHSRFIVVGESADLRSLDVSGLATRGIQTIVLDRAFGPDSNAARFPNDGHFNERGHERIAEFLAPMLAEVVSR